MSEKKVSFTLYWRAWLLLIGEIIRVGGFFLHSTQFLIIGKFFLRLIVNLFFIGGAIFVLPFAFRVRLRLIIPLDVEFSNTGFIEENRPFCGFDDFMCGNIHQVFRQLFSTILVMHVVANSDKLLIFITHSYDHSSNT